LIGVMPSAFRYRDTVPDVAKLFHASALVRHVRNAAGLATVLQHVPTGVDGRELHRTVADEGVRDEERVGASRHLVLLRVAHLDLHGLAVWRHLRDLADRDAEDLHRRTGIDTDTGLILKAEQFGRVGERLASFIFRRVNFDPVISFSGEKISITDVTNALGIASAEMLTRVIGSISDRKPSVVLDVVAELIARGQDARNFCRDLLGVFRDLMVFKVSNGDTGLVENSALNPDDLNDYSSRFTEADFIRFFNSLCETETKLKEAVQPRYVLETGLVKLTEMRRVVAVEQLLERLTQLENMLSNGALDKLPASDAAAATEEKKTLNFKPAVLEEVFEPVESFPPEPEYFSPDPYLERESLPDIESEPVPPAVFEPAEAISQPIIDLGFLDSLPVKLAPIESEALEHVEDTWLDAAYDRKLELAGDDLLPIQDASELAESLFGKQPVVNTSSTGSNGSTALAAAPALSPVYSPPDLDEEEVPEPAALPTDATDEELMAYAASHPLARKAMRIFRAKIVSVKRG